MRYTLQRSFRELSFTGTDNIIVSRPLLNDADAADRDMVDDINVGVK